MNTTLDAGLMRAFTPERFCRASSEHALRSNSVLTDVSSLPRFVDEHLLRCLNVDGLQTLVRKLMTQRGGIVSHGIRALARGTITYDGEFPRSRDYFAAAASRYGVVLLYSEPRSLEAQCPTEP
nr:hypothetical protein CFP56_20622 [Quercus suber]